MTLTDELQSGELPLARLGDVDGAGVDVPVDVAARVVQEGERLGELRSERTRSSYKVGGPSARIVGLQWPGFEKLQ